MAKNVAYDTLPGQGRYGDFSHILINLFLAEKVYVDVLKVIKRHHIERLLKTFSMGDQILFEHHLEEWRNALEIPLGNQSTSRASTPCWPLGRNVAVDSASLSPNTLSRESPSSVSHFHPYSRSPTPEPSPSLRAPSLGIILNESPKAMILCEFYKKFGKFGNEQRSALISAIARFYEEKSTPMTLAVSYRLENEILERFPTEKLVGIKRLLLFITMHLCLFPFQEYYRTSNRGKIYSKWSNSKGSFKKLVEKHVLPKAKKTKGKKTTRPVKDFGMYLHSLGYVLMFNYNCFLYTVPEADAEVCIRALKFDNLSTEEFDSYWKACRQFRMAEIKEMESTTAIFDKWPFYKIPSGFRLVGACKLAL